MTEIAVRSFLGGQRSDFVPIEEYRGKLHDPRHIDGAIELTVCGKHILNKELWDIVDELWIYILQGVEKALNGEVHTTHFPDQPIDIIIRPVATRQLLEISISGSSWRNSAKYDMNAFALALASGAEHCLSKLSQLIGDPGFYDEEMRMIQRIKHKANPSPGPDSDSTSR